MYAVCEDLGLVDLCVGVLRRSQNSFAILGACDLLSLLAENGA
jgi:hypothetical protein